MTNTSDFLNHLNNIKAQSDVIAFLEEEFYNVIDQLNEKGYKVNSEVGFEGPQTLKTIEDLELYQYLRDLLFLFHGANGNWNYLEPTETVYFVGLQQIFQAIYTSKRSI